MEITNQICTTQNNFKLKRKSKSAYRSNIYNVHEFTLTRENKKTTTTDDSYGFTLAGYCPCYVESVDDNSISYYAGVKQADLIMKINDINCCRATMKTCLSLIKNSPLSLNLTVYRFSEPRLSRKLTKSLKIQNTKKITKKKTNKIFLSRFFRPSLWFPCGPNVKLTGCVLNEITLNQTYGSQFNKLTPSPKKSSASQLTTKSSSSQIGVDTGYETSSDTTDSKNKKLGSINEEITDIARTELIENLLEIESNFISYLSIGVAQLARPLRGFLMKQQDYFVLFQNIEKILIISENFLNSMEKWSSLDLYMRIGQLYTQKLNLFREAFTIYAKGHATSRCLLNELKSHSQEFRMFVNETQSGKLTLSNLIDFPLIHIQETLNCFRQILKHTNNEANHESKDTPHIESVIEELRRILSYSNIESNLSLESDDSSDGGTDKLSHDFSELVLMSTKIENKKKNYENV